ncbi:hypothetical protein INT45_011143 [Circinella minor]|uniref:CCHC-type domain-containing protein n=1 Tax=Circinella minor TaxID=1195481 RepID=A0A8H7VMQ4_9FUNG|nr:hypothetical protein INT45_011143 [Circinella minor]
MTPWNQETSAWHDQKTELTNHDEGIEKELNNISKQLESLYNKGDVTRQFYQMTANDLQWPTINHCRDLQLTPPNQAEVYRDRWRRHKIPPFKDGTATEAQQWMEQYERMSKYLGFSEEEQLDELDACMQGSTINWLAGLTNEVRQDWQKTKSNFLYHFGGGSQPSRTALAELKHYYQEDQPMRQFGPKITELLHRAHIFTDELQLDYFMDRISKQLQDAHTIRCPKNLKEAIKIGTEIEYTISRSKQKKNNIQQRMKAPTLPAMTTYETTTPESTASTEEITTTNQNTQENGRRYNRNYNKQNNRNHNNTRYNKKEYHTPNQNKHRSSSNTYKKETRECYSCGKIGHIAKNCYKNKRRNEHQAIQRTDKHNDQEEEFDIFGHLLQGNQQNGETPLRFHSTITLTTSQQQQVLMDTGSTLTSIRRNIVNILNLPTQNQGITNITYSNGTTQTSTMKATLNFHVNEATNTTASAYIVEHQQEDIILGMDWMVKEDILL